VKLSSWPEIGSDGDDDDDEVQHFNLANSATFQILPYFIHLSFYHSILYTIGSTDTAMTV